MVELHLPGNVNDKMIRTRRCKILSIQEADAAFQRCSEIEWLDTGEREMKSWKAARGVNQPVWVVAGPKLNAALRGEGDIYQSGLSKHWVWRGYLETVGV